jgi:hypothetical protein
MSPGEASSYEPYRKHSPGGPLAGEDSEKLIVPEPHEGGSQYFQRSNGKGLRQRRDTRTVRISFRAVAFVLAVTILGVQAYCAYTWLSTRGQYFYNPTTQLNTRAWAIIDGWPTWIMMAAAVVAIIIQLSALTSHLCVCVS